MRVLHTGMINVFGGIESYLINYYRNIDRKKVQFDFINICDENICFQEEITKMGGVVYSVPNYYKHPIKYIKEVIKIIKENDYEIVHCNMNTAVNILPLVAAKLSGAKVIIAHAHNSFSDKGITRRILHNIGKKFIPFFANTYFACSLKAGNWFFSKKIINGNNFYLIKNAIDVDKFKFKKAVRENMRKKLNIGKDTLVIGHVGRFKPQKNHTFLIDIFKCIHDKREDSVLLLIGTGILESDIKEKVKELGLEDSVMFLGQRDDIDSLYNVMDCFVLPSLYEGLPLVGIEAITNGVCTVFSDSITKEVDFLNNSLFISLKESSKVWADYILDVTYQKKGLEFREDIYKKVKNNDYDIKKASQDLLEKYIKRLGDKDDRH